MNAALAHQTATFPLQFVAALGRYNQADVRKRSHVKSEQVSPEAANFQLISLKRKPPRTPAPILI